MLPFTDKNMQTTVTILKSVDGVGFSSKSYQENVPAVTEKFSFFLILSSFFYLIALLLRSKATKACLVMQKRRNDNIDKLPKFPKMPPRVTLEQNKENEITMLSFLLRYGCRHSYTGTISNPVSI